MITRLLTLFIPKPLCDDHQLINRSYLLVGAILSNIATCLVVFISLYTVFELPTSNHNIARDITIACLISYSCILVLFRFFVSYQITAHLTVFLLLAINFYGIQITGGYYYSPVVSMLVITPIMAFLLLGLKPGIGWLITAVSSNVVLLLSAEFNIGYSQLMQRQRDIEILSGYIQFMLYVMAGGTLAIYEVINRRLNRHLKEQKDRFAHEARYDSLTGIPNRVELFNQANLLCKQSDMRGSKFAMIFIDLDNFKLINDQYGHNAGDEVLRVVSANLEYRLRTMDTIARMGGDEFVILLPGIENQQDCQKTISKIERAIAQPVTIGHNTELAIEASIGLAIYPDDSRDIDQLCHIADQSMYIQKNQHHRQTSEKTAVTSSP
jgi:diguanylate cyclase (GGDEF)-like protein